MDNDVYTIYYIVCIHYTYTLPSVYRHPVTHNEAIHPY